MISSTVRWPAQFLQRSLSIQVFLADLTKLGYCQLSIKGLFDMDASKRGLLGRSRQRLESVV